MEKSWPEEFLPFFETLSSPLQDWDPQDFGEEPKVEEKNLLETFKPHIYIGPHALPPIDFYQDYLPHCVLKNKSGKTIKTGPSREDLKKSERSWGLYLDYKGPIAPCRGKKCESVESVLYGRVFHENLRPWKTNGTKGAPGKKVIILKYNPAFSASGLPGRLKWWKSLGSGIIGGSLEDWHQLDIHGAIHIILDSDTLKPLVVLLAQHNHFQSLIIGHDLDWPEDNRVSICFADRSNEPYICPDSEKPQLFRTVGTPEKFDYVFMGGLEPLQGGRDKVYGPQAGGVKLQYQLQFLPSLDPLYTSWIPLGKKRKILGIFKSFSRTGPPGINFNTWPELKNYTDIAQFWYFQPGDQKAKEILNRSFKSFFDLNPYPLLSHHSKIFFKHLNHKKFSK